MKLKIVLFEDQEPEAQLLPALERGLGRKGTARLFVSSGTPEKGIYEDRLSKELSNPDYRDATLIVVDRDLSSTELYGGLSEETVRRVAYDLGIPECAYARGEGKEENFRQLADQCEASIAVSVKDPIKFAAQVVSIAEGFVSLANGLPNALKMKGKRSLGGLLAGILGKPEYAEKISLYASGDQNRLASVLRVRGANKKEEIRQLRCLLGYWLWDSVLRYPGVLVNESAASSYLNIHVQTFRQDSELCGLFKKALYAGPFAEAKGPMWWRGMLDDLVAESGCADGRELAEAKLGKAVPPSECCEDSSKPAGYYCVLSDQPVSLENSKGGLPSFPRGADLARISRKKYEEQVPWL